MVKSQVVIIGAGHNGLIAGFYLAKAGIKVTILERSASPGGAACTFTMPCGCKVSRGANAYGMLDNKIWKEMQLAQRGVKVLPMNPGYTFVSNKGAMIDLFSEIDRTKKSVAAISATDSEQLDRYLTDLDIAVEEFKRNLSAPIIDETDLLKNLNRRGKDLGARFIKGSLRDAVANYFKHPTVQSFVAATALLYPASPDDPGTAYPLVYLGLSEVNGSPGSGVVVGGMGALTAVMANAAIEAGAEIRYRSTVTKIYRNKNTIENVLLSDGTVITTEHVLSNADPVSTCRLFDPFIDENKFYDLDLHFKSNAAKANIVLNRLPPSLSHAIDEVPGRSFFVLNGEFENLAKINRMSSSDSSMQPYIELSLPSLIDHSLPCCSDHHVASLFVLENEHDDCSEYKHIIKAAEEFFPGFSDHVVSVDWLSPTGISATWGMHGGNVDHGNMVPSNRCREREKRVSAISEEISNLSFCGSSRFPGGLVSGRPALLAVQELLGKI